MTEITKTKSGVERKITLLILGSSIIIMMIGMGIGYFLGRGLLRDTVGGAFAPPGRPILQSAIVVLLLCIIMWAVGYLFSRILAKPLLEDLSLGPEKRRGERARELERAHGAALNMPEGLTEAKRGIEKYSSRPEDGLKAKAEFASAVSHELRAPLAVIKEGIAIVLDGTDGPINKKQRTFLEIAKKNVDRLVELISDILDFHNFESGKMVFKMDDNDINETVKESTAVMAARAKDKRLNFILNLDDKLPRVKFDKNKIMQVLTNLTGNAVKFTDKGSVSVTTALDEDFIKVSVHDTGVGIRQEDTPMLFQYFEQIGRGAERETGGTGLGLAISKRIIEQHHGRIWAESEFGKGSTFTFVLPVR